GATVSSHPGGAGINDTIINVSYNSSFISGSLIKVQAAACLTSAVSNLAVFVTGPAAAGIISGPIEACSYIGTINLATYTIRKVAGASSYAWAVPAGATIYSHPAGSGVNDTIVKVYFNSSFVSGSSISVQAVSCTASDASNLAIFKQIAPSPGPIN